MCDLNSYTILVVWFTLSVFIYSKTSSATESGTNQRVDWHKTKIWGPGLKAGFVVPARYFFIQLRAENGEK